MKIVSIVVATFITIGLQAQLKPELVIPVGHSTNVSTARFSADGKLLVSEAENIKVWNVASGKLLHTLENLDDLIISPNGKWFVTKKTQKQKDSVTRDQIYFFDDITFSFANSPNGKVVFQKKITNTNFLHLQDFRFSNNGKYILAILESQDEKENSWASSAQIWDIENGNVVNEIKGSYAEISNGNDFIVSSTKEGEISVWRESSNSILYSLAGSGFGISSKGDRMIVTSTGAVKIVDLGSGNILGTVKGDFVQFSKNGKVALVRLADQFKIVEMSTGKVMVTLGGAPKKNYRLDFSRDGDKLLAVDEQDTTVRVWNLATGKWFTIRKPLTKDYRADFKYFKAAFSPKGNLIVTQADPEMDDMPDLPTDAKIWDAQTGKLIKRIEGRFFAFSHDGNRMLTSGSDYKGIQIQLWELANGIPKSFNYISYESRFSGMDGYRELKADFLYNGHVQIRVKYAKGSFIYNEDHIRDEKFQFICSGTFLSANSSGDLIAFGNRASVELRESKSGKLKHELSGKYNEILQTTFSPDGQSVLTVGSDLYCNVWNAATGKLIRLSGHTQSLASATFSPDSKFIGTSSYDSTARIWELPDGKLNHTLYRHNNVVRQNIISPGGKWIATYSNDQTMKIWEMQTGQCINTFEDVSASDFAFSPDGAKFFFKTGIYDCATGKKLFRIDGIGSWNSDTRPMFSPDGKWIVTTADSVIKIWNNLSRNLAFTLQHRAKYWGMYAFFAKNGQLLTFADSTVTIWNPTTGKLVKSFSVDGAVNYAALTLDGKRLFVSTNNGVKIVNVASGKLEKQLTGVNEGWMYTFSPDEKRFATFGEKLISIWEAETGKLIRSFQTGTSYALSPDWKSICISNGPKITRWNVESGEEQISIYSLGNSDWVVTHPSGLFDASQGALTQLYYTQGMDVIDLSQLKDRYYEPGLWKKVIAGEQLRNVVGFKSIDLPPDIHLGQIDGKGYLTIDLTNRGGGIGEVNVFINGKEVIKDAREANANPEVASLSIKVFVGTDKSIVKGQDNIIGVRAWNKDHWVVSRGQVVSYLSKEMEQYKPSIYILSCGVSDYTGDEIDLKYAAKDASDVGLALSLGAKKLFGTEKSYLYNLTTAGPKESYPTKVNILKAFDKISSTAHPLDVFVMYVSGHGINFGGQDGDWHYLAQDAYTASASAYSDPAIRQQTTISSNELVELFKKVPALKQVLLIDACASGKVVDNLIAKKDIESSTLRALDRMRDRTGMHIITGCTADAVSYEASKYGQGVLTYSLLEGIRGAALRDDQFVDVNKLFQYAQDRVPKLAEGIGGIQSPQVFSPQGSQSFDIGLLGDVEKKAIPIARIRPVFVRSNFLDENEMEDVLGLGKMVDESLGEVSSKGVDSSIIFVDVREYPDGCKLSGTYKRENGKISLKLKKRCGSEVKSFDLKGENVDVLKAEILKTL